MEARSVDGASDEGACRLSDLYEEALPEVYRYLRSRCGSTPLAEDLTSSVFVQAALSVERGQQVALSTGWLITVARNKLIDHWRRQAVAERPHAFIDSRRLNGPRFDRSNSSDLRIDGPSFDGWRPDDAVGEAPTNHDEPWDAVLDQTLAQTALAELPPHYRSALTLRYLDDLPVSQCAELLNRSVRATESLLARARNQFRTTYEKNGGCHD